MVFSTEVWVNFATMATNHKPMDVSPIAQWIQNGDAQENKAKPQCALQDVGMGFWLVTNWKKGDVMIEILILMMDAIIVWFLGILSVEDNLLSVLMFVEIGSLILMQGNNVIMGGLFLMELMVASITAQ